MLSGVDDRRSVTTSWYSGTFTATALSSRKRAICCAGQQGYDRPPLGLRRRELFPVHEHFGAAAPVHGVDLLGAQPPRGGGAVHRGVATAEHHDALTHLDRTPAIRALEEHDARHDAGGVLARDARIVWLEATRCDKHRVVLVVQLPQRDIAADIRRQAELDVFVDDAVDVAVDDLARQPERRHARELRPSSLVEGVVDGDAEAELRKVARGGEPGAARADDRHLAARRSEHRCGRLRVRVAVDPHVLVRPVGQELLHVADREGLVDLFAPARRLARRSAHRTADRRHGVRIERELPALLELTRRGEIQVPAAIRLDGAGLLARDVVLIPAGTYLYDLVELSHRGFGHATGA